MTSIFFIGGKISGIALSNIDLSNILPKVTKKPWVIMRYSDLTPEMELTYWTILLYQYPNQIGHWVLIKCNASNREL
jgi:hypothetical protein